MNTYELTLIEKEFYVLEVDAESEEEAIDKAYALISTEEGRYTYHSDSDGEYEIELLE